MPELPEVETVRRGLLPHLIGRRIAAVTVREPRLRWPVSEGLQDLLLEQTVTGLDRRGKYLLVRLGGGDTLIVHLGMSGRLRIFEGRMPPPVKHDHIDWLFHGGGGLRYHDPRRFGAMLHWPHGQAGHALLDHLGPEPFDAAFSAGYLHARSRGRQVAVKSFLMDGRTVVGCGNIYAAEALFRAGIRPARRAGTLTRPDCGRLVTAVQAVLGAAIEQGGTTLRDFAGADGVAGYFQQDLYVYGREGLPCRVCGSVLRGQRIGQRASGWCPSCQR